MAKIVTRYVWEVPVRVTHWVNVAAIVILSITGLYIGAPKTLAIAPSAFVMGWVRFVHFVTAYAFSVSLIGRIYWAFAGNSYASWREFVPFISRDGVRKMFDTFRYYTFMTRKVPHVEGHNALAGATYLLVFILYLVMLLTGFALYVERAPNTIMHVAFGWMSILFTNQGIRLTHHMVMWLLLAFAIHHVYSAWLMDIKEKGGVISSIFGGYKQVEEKE